MTRLLRIAILAFPLAIDVVGQPPAKTTSAKAAGRTTAPLANDIFSGTVTASAPGSLTVVRKVPARADEYRTFVVDKDTKIEGRLRMNARVTIRYKADGDSTIRALHVIVRAEPKTNAGPGRAVPGQ